MQSRLSSALFAALVFGTVFALAGPVPEAKNELEARTVTPLVAILNICLDLQVKLKVILVLIAKLNGKGSCADLVGQIVVLINACITAILNVGVVVDLKDTVTLNAIASVMATIILDIHAHITVFASILVNILAVIKLDLAIQGLLVNLNVCVAGILTIIAPLCVSLTVSVNLVLNLVVLLLHL